MRCLINPILIFLLFLGTSAVTSAQPMDYEWSQQGQYFGLSTPQPGMVVLYERQGQEWQVTDQFTYATHLPKPQQWSYLDGALYGVSTDLDIGYLFSYSWKEEQSLTVRILHPELTALAASIDGQWSIEKNQLCVQTPQTKACMDLEANQALYYNVSTNLSTPQLMYTTYVFRGVGLMYQAYGILGSVLACILVGVGVFFYIQRKVFYLGRKELSNQFKRIPITAEMYFMLKSLAENKQIANKALTALFHSPGISQDTITKRKNRMVEELNQLITQCFMVDFFTREKDPEDLRETRYVLCEGIRIRLKPHA
jgi:hypothetical protein